MCVLQCSPAGKRERELREITCLKARLPTSASRLHQQMRNALLTHPSLDPSLPDIECVLHRHMCVSLRGCGGKMTECAFSLVITRQRLRGESEICSKHSTFNRRQRASSRHCNHHIIYYSFYMLFVVRSLDLFLRPVLFGGFLTAQTHLHLQRQPERACEHLSVTFLTN